MLHTLSKKAFGISIQFHCFAFLDFVFDAILCGDHSMTALQPQSNKKDRVLLKMVEQTFCILMDQMDEDERSAVMQHQEDPYIAVTVEKMEGRLALLLSDYSGCDPLTVSKFFLFWIFIKKIKQKDSGYTLHYDKLVEFTLITANHMSTDLTLKYCGDESDAELVKRLDDLNLLNKFRVDFLRILHDQIRWHQALDDHLAKSIERINTINTVQTKGDHEEAPLEYVVINGFSNNHTETFLLMWMSRFSSLVDDKLNALRHQDINAEFLGMIDAIDQFIVISSQYKDRVTIENRVRWSQSVPPLNKIVVFKFKQWINKEVAVIFKRAVDTMIREETWSNGKHRRSSSIMVDMLDLRKSDVMSSAVADALRESVSVKTADEHVSDYIIDLSTLTDSMTNACLSFMMSLRIHDLKDSKAYWKMLHREFDRISAWICKDVTKKISFLVPPLRVLSRNVLVSENEKVDIKKVESVHKKFLKRFTTKVDEEVVQKLTNEMADDEGIDNVFGKKKKRSAPHKRKRGRELMQLAMKMHSIDFMLTSLERTKTHIVGEYRKFMLKEFQDRTDAILQREVSIKLRDCNIFRFLSENFVFIPLNPHNDTGMVVATVLAPALEKQFEISIGFELMRIGEASCKGRKFSDLLEWIKDEFNEISVEETPLVFGFNVEGAVETLFHPISERLGSNLNSLSRLISTEIVFDDLQPVLFGRLYHNGQPIDQTRWSDLNVSRHLFKICEPIFDVLNDRNFKLVIRDLFDQLMFAASYILTENFHVDTREWIRNDHQLMEDDINEVIASFEHDIDAEYIEAKTSRVRSLLEMIKASTNHLTQRSLPLLQNKHAHCGNGHILFECVVHPHLLAKLDEIGPDDVLAAGCLQESKRLIRCARCRLYINIRYRVHVIGYYFCGDLSCNEQGLLYCGKCCNDMMCQQDADGIDFDAISKRDVISMLNKRKNTDKSRQFAVKYAQSQCLRTQIAMPKKKPSERKKSKNKVIHVPKMLRRSDSGSKSSLP